MKKMKQTKHVFLFLLISLLMLVNFSFANQTKEEIIEITTDSTDQTHIVKKVMITENVTTDSPSVNTISKNNNLGIGMALIAMGVVVLAFLLLFLIFSYISTHYSYKGTKKFLLKKGKVEEAEKIKEDTPGEVYAAIAMALYLYQSDLNDQENTVLTIQKVARSYSPWSSKIYGLRHNP